MVKDEFKWSTALYVLTEVQFYHNLNLEHLSASCGKKALHSMYIPYGPWKGFVTRCRLVILLRNRKF